MSVLVSVGVLSLSCTSLIFIDPGTKIEVSYYQDTLLGHHFLSVVLFSVQQLLCFPFCSLYDFNHLVAFEINMYLSI